MKKFRILILIASFLVVNSSFAAYNANIVGEVSNVLVYDNGQIMFSLVNQPATHPACNPSYFAIDNTYPEVVIDRLYSRLLSAHATKVPINIGYDNTGNCVITYIRAHRAG